MSAIGHQEVFRLNGWSRQIHTPFQGWRVTWENTRQVRAYIYGAITLYGATFQWTSTSHRLSHCPRGRQTPENAPTTPQTQPLPGITCLRFSLIRFRSPLLSESQLFSLPMGTEMFHFPTFPPHTLFHSGAVNRTQLRLGSPIRTPPDHSSVANSPGLIAGSNVLHRLLMPRHPPCALCSLPNTNTQQKQQRHTLQKQTPTQTPTPHPTHHNDGPNQGAALCGRCSRPLFTNQTTRDQPAPTPPQKGGPGPDVSEPQQCVRSTPAQPTTGRSTQHTAAVPDQQQATTRGGPTSTTPLSEHHHQPAGRTPAAPPTTWGVRAP